MEPEVYRQWYEFEKDHWWTKGMRRLCRDIISRLHTGDRDSCILDIGCGTGALVEELGTLGTAFGADFAGEALLFCKKRGIKRLISTRAESAGFKNNIFSLIVAFCLIEHIEEDRSFLKEMRRILKDGGHLIILTSAFGFLWSQHDEIAHHKRRYTCKRIKELMQAGDFRVSKISYANFFLFPIIAIIRIFQRVLHIKHRIGNRFLLDVINMPGFLENMLYAVLRIESALLRYVNFPFGVSIICVGQKIEGRARI